MQIHIFILTVPAVKTVKGMLKDTNLLLHPQCGDKRHFSKQIQKEKFRKGRYINLYATMKFNFCYIFNVFHQTPPHTQNGNKM